jgi:hypothetical protein
MTIYPADTPDPAREAVVDGMKRRAAERGFWTPQLRSADLNALQLCYPHRVAILPLSGIRPGTSLRSAAQIVGWRFLIRDPHGYIAAALAFINDAGEYRLSELNEGTLVNESRLALEELSRDGPAREILLVVAPAVSVAAMWLLPKHSDKDRVLLVASPHRLDTGIIDAVKFMDKLVKLSEDVPAKALAGG